MKSHLGISRFIAYTWVIVCLAWGAPQSSMGLSNPCEYNPEKPSYDHARKAYRNVQYRCAEEEIQLLLVSPDISERLQARAHMLLACIRFQTTPDTEERRRATTEELLKVYRVYPMFNEDTEIYSLEFVTLMDRAQKQVEAEYRQSTSLQQYRDELQVKVDKERKPWYKKWWVYGIGAGVAASAVAIFTGGDDPVPPLDSLPGFPDPPAAR